MYIYIYTLEESPPLDTFTSIFGALKPLADTLEALVASFWYVLAPSGDHCTNLVAHRGTQGKMTAKVRGRGAHVELNRGRFSFFCLIFDGSKCVFFATCRQIGFKCFRGTFFRTPGSANIWKI